MEKLLALSAHRASLARQSGKPTLNPRLQHLPPKISGKPNWLTRRLHDLPPILYNRNRSRFTALVMSCSTHKVTFLLEVLAVYLITACAPETLPCKIPRALSRSQLEGQPLPSQAAQPHKLSSFCSAARYSRIRAAFFPRSPLPRREADRTSTTTSVPS